MFDSFKTQAIAEALESYIQRLRECNSNQAAIDLYTEILKEFDPNNDYT
jgi:hypothetical protein